MQGGSNEVMARLRQAKGTRVESRRDDQELPGGETRHLAPPDCTVQALVIQIHLRIFKNEIYLCMCVTDLLTLLNVWLWLCWLWLWYVSKGVYTDNISSFQTFSAQEKPKG